VGDNGRRGPLLGCYWIFRQGRPTKNHGLLWISNNLSPLFSDQSFTSAAAPPSFVAPRLRPLRRAAGDATRRQGREGEAEHAHAGISSQRRPRGSVLSGGGHPTGVPDFPFL
jgi:hypothetical protein